MSQPAAIQHRRTLTLDPRAPEVVPRYLGNADRPWLRELLDLYASAVGATVGDLEDRIRVVRPRLAGAPGTIDAAVHVLGKLHRSKVASPIAPRTARRALFTSNEQDPRETWQQASQNLGVTRRDLEESLFADLQSQRQVVAPEAPLSIDDLVAWTNLHLVQRALRDAHFIELTLSGNARDVLRYIHLVGLIGDVRSGNAGRVVVEISGPLALFRKTTVYGRALAGLVPRLAWCEHFELRANCSKKDRAFTLRVSSGACIFPSDEPKRFDSKVEQRFFRDFHKATKEWRLLREPTPVAVRDTVLFPDFEIQPVTGTTPNWFLEIVGFWTRDYLLHKVRQFQDAPCPRLILCVDQTRQADELPWPGHARVIPYRRRVPVDAVLQVLAGARNPRLTGV